MSTLRRVSSGVARDAALACIAAAAAFILAEIIHSTFGVTRLSILFLAAVTVAASMSGGRAALITAFAGLFAFKVFLDLRTVEETTPAEDALNLVIFLIVALITGTLAGKVRDEAAKSQLRAHRMELLFKASRTLTDENEQSLWATLANTLSGASGGTALALDSTASVRASSGGSEFEPAAQFARELLRSRSDLIVRNGHWRGRTINSTDAPLGALVWEAPDDEAELNGVVDLLTDLASASLTRSHIRQEQVRLRATEEAAKLREALLSSISHDFRSPLAAIIGSATSLLEYGNKFDGITTKDLLLNIQHEGERLNQFVANLLNMTRLQSGVIQPSIQHIGAAEVVSSAVDRLKRHHGDQLAIGIEGTCEVEADPLLLEQALHNVLENAVKYGNPAAGIAVRCNGTEEACHIVVADRGPGLAAEDLSDVFNSFHFAKKGGQTKGTGLGLSITRGFVEAMGGTVEARDRLDGSAGLEVVFKLPKRGS